MISQTVVVCILGLALAVVDDFCNGNADCSAGECCASAPGFHEGTKGVCKPYLRVNQPCTPGTAPEGTCGCGHAFLCYGRSGDSPRCHIILP